MLPFVDLMDNDMCLAVLNFYSPKEEYENAISWNSLVRSTVKEKFMKKKELVGDFLQRIFIRQNDENVGAVSDKVINSLVENLQLAMEEIKKLVEFINSKRKSIYNIDLINFFMELLQTTKFDEIVKENKIKGNEQFKKILEGLPKKKEGNKEELLTKIEELNEFEEEKSFNQYLKDRKRILLKQLEEIISNLDSTSNVIAEANEDTNENYFEPLFKFNDLDINKIPNERGVCSVEEVLFYKKWIVNENCYISNPINFRNVGNSCYFDSVIQCLLFTPMFEQYMRVFLNRYENLSFRNSEGNFLIYYKNFINSFQISKNNTQQSDLFDQILILMKNYNVDQEDAYLCLERFLDELDSDLLKVIFYFSIFLIIILKSFTNTKLMIMLKIFHLLLLQLVEFLVDIIPLMIIVVLVQKIIKLQIIFVL